MGSHSLHQGIFLTPGSNLALLYCRQILYHLNYQKSPSGYLGFLTIFHYLQQHCNKCPMCLFCISGLQIPTRGNCGSKAMPTLPLKWLHHPEVWKQNLEVPRAVSIMSSPTRHFKMLSILGIQWYLFSVFISRCLMKTVFEHLLTCISSFMNCLFISFAHFSKGCLFVCFPTYICYTHSLLHKHKLQNFLLVFSLPFMLLGYLVLFCFVNFFWNIVDLQCCVSFKCTAKWFGYTYMCIYIFLYLHIYIYLHFPGVSVVKNLSTNAGGMGSTPGSGRPPG